MSRPLDRVAAAIEEAAEAVPIDPAVLRALAAEVRGHAPIELTDQDHVMFRHAKRRGLVRLDSGEEFVLIAWRPTKHRGTARVSRPGGNSFTIPYRRVAEIIETATP